jgi:hypothetical protein
MSSWRREMQSRFRQRLQALNAAPPWIWVVRLRLGEVTASGSRATLKASKPFSRRNDNMTGTTQDAELDYYKRQPIGRLAVQLGAAAKNPKPKPTRGGDIDAENFVLNGWKFQCFQASSGHYMWKSHDGSLTVRGRNAGTIVDIAVELDGSIGKARQRLRALTGYSPSSTTSTTTVQQETTPAAAAAIPLSSRPVSPPAQANIRSAADLLAEYESEGVTWTDDQRLPSYLVSRHLDAIHPVFSQTFRHSCGQRKNLAFPYHRFNDDGTLEFSGRETKNFGGFVGYSESGRAGIFMAYRGFPKTFVVTESAVEAMSYARLMTDYDDYSVGFIAIRSGGEASAVELLKRIAGCGELRFVVLATNQDAAGFLYAHKVSLGLSKVPDLTVRFEAPLHAQNDWNDALREDRKHRASSAGGGPRPDVIEAERPEEKSKSPAEIDPRDGIELG